MSNRPSDALIKLLRDTTKQRGFNTAALAKMAGIHRNRLKQVFSGSQPITVDEMIQVSSALNLGPEEFSAFQQALEENKAKEVEKAKTTKENKKQQTKPPAAKPKVELQATGDDDFAVDPYGNHAEQALRLAFSLGCDIFLVLDTPELEASGIPESVQTSFPKGLPIRLDAAFHRHNAPRFTKTGLQLHLSFDGLHTCLIPWQAFKQVTFFPMPPPDPPEEDDDVPQRTTKAHHLRLVE